MLADLVVRARTPIRIAGALAGIVAVAACARLVGLNASATGFLLLIGVLLAATGGGFPAGLAASLAASTAYTFFLPPLASVRVSDPENWVALVAFLTAATVASRLVARARAEAERATARARELAAVHTLTVEVLRVEHDLASLAHLGGDALVAAGADGAGLVTIGEGGPVVLGWSGEPLPPRLLSEVARATAEPARDVLHQEEMRLLPVRTTQGLLGVVTAWGAGASSGAAEAVARVLHLAVERERLRSERARLEAARESEAMRTAILRAISHDLSTPLAAIRFQVDALERLTAGTPASVAVGELDAECARLARRIGDLLSLARLESGTVRPRIEPVPAADLFRAARESLPRLGRPIEVRIEASCPDLFADPALALEIVVNLLENAHRASTEATPIELVAGAGALGVRLGVLDRGRGIDGGEPGRELVGNELPAGGLGLEIARRFAAANGGTLSLQSRAGGGIAAWVDLPAAATGAQ